MAYLNFDFVWDDEEKTILRYRAKGEWTWKDYHYCVRQSLFALHHHERDVDCIIDVRGGTRETLPAGIGAHVRTFGKKQNPNLTGRAVVIGFPADAVDQLCGAGRDELATPDGVIKFVDDDYTALTVIQGWRGVAG